MVEGAGAPEGRMDDTLQENCFQGSQGSEPLLPSCASQDGSAVPMELG